MKELSIEEKAKAYDGNYKVYKELINRLEDVKEAIKKQNYGIAMDILFKPYPDFQVTTHSELKESEDERMKNAAIRACKYMIDNFENSTKDYEDALAWLEKQGNNMGISETTKQKLEDNLNKALEKETPESCNEFLDEQKSADKVEPKFKVGDTVTVKPMSCHGKVFKGEPFKIVDIIEDNYVSDDGKAYSISLQDGWELVEQKPAWSEEDKKMSRFIGNAITADDSSIYLESKGIQVIDAHVWLDGLKERVQPQSQWKPSEEQMDAVKSAALDIAKFSSRSEQLRLENEPYYKALMSLYNDLEKLREE